MIKESEIVTKNYLENNFVTKKYLKESLGDFVTKKYLHDTLHTEMKRQKMDILREVRVMIHESLEGAMDNAKEYYAAEMKLHTTALLQGFKDEMRYYKDEMKTLMNKLDNHEARITTLESA